MTEFRGPRASASVYTQNDVKIRILYITSGCAPALTLRPGAYGILERKKTMVSIKGPFLNHQITRLRGRGSLATVRTILSARGPKGEHARTKRI